MASKGPTSIITTQQTAPSSLAKDTISETITTTTKVKVKLPNACHFFPTRPGCMPANYPGGQDQFVNDFYQTAGKLSYFNQVKSIYNGASASTTISADLASLNFSDGMQVTAGTNIQAGSVGTPQVASGPLPVLSAASAGQATQNILYGGTVTASILYPFLYLGSSKVDSPSQWGLAVDLLGREGVDIQNFKAQTSTNVDDPDSHGSVQLESYMVYNSTKTTETSSDFDGSIFIGGSYGYNYISHGYSRDYGFADKVNTEIGQASFGIVISGVAKLEVSRAFGPSQKYTDSTSLAATKVNNFKSWSFGITYQAASPKTGS